MVSHQIHGNTSGVLFVWVYDTIIVDWRLRSNLCRSDKIGVGMWYAQMFVISPIFGRSCTTLIGLESSQWD